MHKMVCVVRYGRYILAKEINCNKLSFSYMIGHSNSLKFDFKKRRLEKKGFNIIFLNFSGIFIKRS